MKSFKTLDCQNATNETWSKISTTYPPFPLHPYPLSCYHSSKCTLVFKDIEDSKGNEVIERKLREKAALYRNMGNNLP